MRILLAGATGVLGRATLPHLRGQDVIGLTRSPDKAQLLRTLGAEPAVCDVFDSDALMRVAQRARPDTVVNFVTDFASGFAGANNVARRVGGKNLFDAAGATGASRLVVESVAFALDGEAREAVDYLELTTRTFARDALILRFGRLWGPDTFYGAPPHAPAVHVERAGAEAARLLVQGTPGTHIVA